MKILAELDQRYLIFLIMVFMSLIVSPGLIFIAYKINFLDNPSSEAHKRHQKPIPAVGGIILIISVLLLLLVLFLLDSSSLIMNAYFIAAIVLVFVVGLIDDMKQLSARLKSIFQITAGILLIFGGFQVEVTSIQIVDIAISLFWFVGIMNAVNFIDSSDGLVLGISTVICSFLALFSYINGQIELSLLSIAFVGIFIGMLFYNFPPAKLYMGDSGTLPLGLVLAVFALEYNPIGKIHGISWFLPILILALPIFDVVLVVVSRLRRKLPIFVGRLDHTFHRLQRLISERAATGVMILAAMVLNLLGFWFEYLQKKFEENSKA